MIDYKSVVEVWGNIIVVLCKTWENTFSVFVLTVYKTDENNRFKAPKKYYSMWTFTHLLLNVFSSSSRCHR